MEHATILLRIKQFKDKIEMQFNHDQFGILYHSNDIKYLC